MNPSENSLIEACRLTLQQTVEEGFSNVLTSWTDIYGTNDVNLRTRISEVKQELKMFWEYMIESLEEKKSCIMKSIETGRKEALDLEKSLGLPSEVNQLPNNVPLVQQEERVWEVNYSYQDKKEQRLKEYASLQEQNRSLEARLVREELQNEVHSLKEEVGNLLLKMMKSPQELEDCLKEEIGLKSIAASLRAKLAALKNERKATIKDLIATQRELLDDMWTKCCFSDEQRADFSAYNSHYYSEDVLNLLSLEVNRLKHFYAQNESIFKLIAQYQQLWNRFLELEEAASDTGRLFRNRGGRLLQDERAIMKKKVPALKSELLQLIEEYRYRTNKKFLYFGKPIEVTLQEMEDRLKIKTITIRKKKGPSPAPLSLTGNKRKMVTSQQPSKFLKMCHTVASSTATDASDSSISCIYGSQIEEDSGSYVLRRTPVRTAVRAYDVSSADNAKGLVFRSFNKRCCKEANCTEKAVRCCEDLTSSRFINVEPVSHSNP